VADVARARRSPWPVVAALVALLAVLWPPETGHSLALKGINWIADPRGELPRRPSPLAIGVDDDADVVTAHDTEEHAYDAMYRGSWTGRLRLQLRDAEDPLEPSTERPLLVAAAAVVAVWLLRRR
jgi:MYXO-CTERM domain-containing protein